MANGLVDGELLESVTSSWLPAESRGRPLLAKLSEVLQIKLKRIIETFDPEAPPNELNSTAFIAIQSLLNETNQQGVSILNGLSTLAPFSLPDDSRLPRTANLTADIAALASMGFNRSQIHDLDSAIVYISQVSSRMLLSAMQLWLRIFVQDRNLVGQLNDILDPTFIQNISIAIWSSGTDGINWESYGVPSDEASCLNRAVSVVKQILSAPLIIQNTSISNGIPLHPPSLDLNTFQRCKLRRHGRNIFSSSDFFQQSTIFSSSGVILNTNPVLEAYGALQITAGVQGPLSFFNSDRMSVTIPRKPLGGNITIPTATIVTQQTTNNFFNFPRVGLPSTCEPGFASNYTLATNTFNCYMCNASRWCPGTLKNPPTASEDVAVENICSNGPQTSPASIIYTHVAVSTSNCPFLCIDQFKYYDPSQNLCINVPGGKTRRPLQVGSDPAALIDCATPLPSFFYEWNQECSYNSLQTAIVSHQQATVQKLGQGLSLFLNFKAINSSRLAFGQTLVSLFGIVELSVSRNSSGAVTWLVRLLESRNGAPTVSLFSSVDQIDLSSFARVFFSLRKVDNTSVEAVLSRDNGDGLSKILFASPVAPLFTSSIQMPLIRIGDEIELKSISIGLGQDGDQADSNLILSIPEALWFDSAVTIAAPTDPSTSVPFSLTGILTAPCVPSISVRFINITLSGNNIPAVYPRWIEAPQLPTAERLVRCKLQTPSRIWIDIQCPPWPSNLLVSGIGVSFEYANTFTLASPLPFALKLYSQAGSDQVWSVAVQNFAGTTFLSGSIGPHAVNSNLHLALESTLAGAFCRPCPERTIFSFESLGGCVCEAGYELQPNRTCSPDVRRPDLPIPGDKPSVGVVGYNSTVYTDPLGTIEVIIPAAVRTAGVPDSATLIVLVSFDQGLPSSQYGIPATSEFPVPIVINRPFALLDRVQLRWFSEFAPTSPIVEFRSIGEPVIMSATPILQPSGGEFFEPINVFFSANRNPVDPFYFVVSKNGGPFEPATNPIKLASNTSLSIRIVGFRGEFSRQVFGAYTFLTRAAPQSLSPGSSSLGGDGAFVCGGGCIAGIVIAFVAVFSGIAAVIVYRSIKTAPESSSTDSK